VVQTQNFLMLVIEVAVEGRWPGPNEVIAIGLGVAGSTIIALAKDRKE
jgi:hypothetical protein